MARRESSTEERVRRSVARTVRRWMTVLLLVGALLSWAYTGLYRLDPGEAAIILQFGRYVRTEVRGGLHWHLPPPIQAHDVVRVGTVMREEFGDVNAKDPAARAETAMQTGDNNIVNLEFVLRYRVANPFESRYRVAQLRRTIRDSAQAAMREVVGRNTIDGVLSDERAAVEVQTVELLQKILDRYSAGISVEGVDLQEVQPPDAVRGAFDEVIAAGQDRSRKVREAEGYANEVIPKARAKSAEIVAAAAAYRDAKITESRGESARFLSLLAAYRQAPAITRKRLYLETMEEVLPGVEKVLIEPGAGPVLPYLPLGNSSARKPSRKETNPVASQP